MLPQSEVFEVLLPYHDVIWDCIASAWDDALSKEDGKLTPYKRTVANDMYECMRNRFNDLTARFPEIVVREVQKHEQFYVEVNGKLLFFVKQADEDMQTKSIATQRALKLFTQETLPGIPDKSRCFVTYLPNWLSREIQAIHVCAFERKDMLLWSYEIEREVSMTEAAPVLPMFESEEVPMVAAKLKPSKGAENLEGSEGK